MADPAQLDLKADRGLFFVESIPFLGDDLTGADLDMHIRSVADGTGLPLIDLDMVITDAEGVRLMYAGTATIAAHIAAGRLTNGILQETNPATGVHYVNSDSVLLSVVRILADMDNRIPHPAEEGDDWVGAYDLIVEKPSAVAVKYLAGAFIVRPTVTQ